MTRESLRTKWEARRRDYARTHATLDGVAVADEVLSDLSRLASIADEVGIRAHAVEVDRTPQERFWTAPSNVRMNTRELAAALGKPVSWIHKHTSRRSGLPVLPHRKVEHRLVFVLGDVREWLQTHEIIMQP